MSFVWCPKSEVEQFGLTESYVKAVIFNLDIKINNYLRGLLNESPKISKLSFFGMCNYYLLYLAKGAVHVYLCFTFYSYV